MGMGEEGEGGREPHFIFREESETFHDSLRPVQELLEQPLHLKFGNFKWQQTSR